MFYDTSLLIIRYIKNNNNFLEKGIVQGESIDYIYTILSSIGRTFFSFLRGDPVV